MGNRTAVNGSLCAFGSRHSAEIIALKETCERIDGTCLQVVREVGDLKVKQALSLRQLLILSLVCLLGALAGNGGGHALVQLLSK